MTDLLRQTPATAPESNIGPPLPLPGPTVVCDLVRADDNLSVTVFMYAMDKVPTRTRWTLAPAPGKTGTIIVKLSAQHIMEYADTPDQVAPPQAAPVYGPSSLVVFSVPPGTPPIELSVRGILEAIANLPLQVASGVPTVHAGSGALRETGTDDGTVLATRLRRTAARAIDPASRLTVETPDVPPAEDDSGPGQTPLPGPPPASSATALAVPSRLRMSPAGGDTRFRHAAAPVERIGSVELWHSRLSVRQADGSHVEAAVPAVVFGAITSSTTEVDEVWNSAVGDFLFHNPLTNAVAQQIAARAKSPVTSTTAPLDLRELVLSPMGATLDVSGSWPGQSYKHHAVLGRDDEVRVDVDGTLFPFGHEARLTEITRRLPTDDHDATPVALKTEAVLYVRKPVVEYESGDKIGRSFPWRRIEIVNRISPPGTRVEHNNSAKLLTLTVAGQPFRSSCVAVDHAGNESSFTVPLLFVANGASRSEAEAAWNGLDKTFKEVELHGQPLAVAPAAGGANTLTGEAGTADATTILTNVVQLSGTAPTAGAFRPQVSSFTGISPALGTLAGQAEKKFEYASQYLDAAFRPSSTDPKAPVNPGELVLTVGETLVNAAADAAGLASIPQLPIRGISRTVGAIAAASDPNDAQAFVRNLDAAAHNVFDPQAYFGDLPATLFGIFPIKELLAKAQQTLELAKDAPKQVVETHDGLRKVKVSWSATLVRDGKSFSPAGNPFLSLTAENGDITLDMTSVTSADSAGRVTSRSTTTIKNAKLALGVQDQDLITLPIPSILFESTDGAAPTVDVQLGKVDFFGPLAFVKTLADLIAKTGLGGARPSGSARGRAALGAGSSANGPYVDVNGERVQAGLALAVPDLAIGMFSLQDLNFGSHLNLFFDGRPPELVIDFATYDNPFRASVSAIAGGGYLGIALTTKGISGIDGKLEFGAAIAIDIGIASGRASVMAGVYFNWNETTGLALTGYLRAEGHVEVMKIASMSLVMEIYLAYEQNVLLGAAEVSFSVRLLFFHKTFRAHVERKFVGANADPTFAELMAPAGWPAGEPLPWDTYCQAFAAA